MKHTNINTRGALILSILAFVSAITWACQAHEIKPAASEVQLEAASESSESGGSDESGGALQTFDMEAEQTTQRVCWTFLRPPACQADPAPQFTCCDFQTCYTFDSEPVCTNSGEAYVCCAE